MRGVTVMKYDLSRLNKKDYETIIKSLPPKFTGLGYFHASHHSVVDENTIEMYDKDLDLMFDMWGIYQKDENCTTIMASDYYDFFSVEVLLYEDHFEIPEYENEDSVFYFEKTQEHQKEYRKLLDEIFKNKKSKLDSDNDDQPKS